MLDYQTAQQLHALLFLVLPVLAWWILPRQADHAADWWHLGGLMAGLGVVLLGLRPWVPLVVGHHLANTLILGCFLCCTQSLRITQRCAWSWQAWVSRLALLLVFYSVLYAWTTDAWRGVFFRSALGGMGLYTALWAWRLSRSVGGFHAHAIAFAFAGIGLSYEVHSCWRAWLLLDAQALGSTMDSSVMSLLAVFTQVIVNFSYVGMVLDMAARERLQVLQARQAAQQSHWLDTRLSHLDRRGHMAIVSGTLAHELRQPLTAASVNAQLALRQWTSAPTEVPLLLALLEQVETAVERTVHIVQRIRDRHAVVTPRAERVDLQSVLDQALRQVAPQLQRWQVTLTHERSARPVVCLGDGLGLSQVVTNLLDKALQAMAGQAQRHLDVACTVQQGLATLVVRDSGPGMPEAVLARWGEPFLSTRKNGLGLGLAISRDIVERHRGQLQLHNRPSGGLQAVLSMALAEGAPA